MSRPLQLLCALALLAAAASAGRLVDGAFTVDGQPFYPLGSWPGPETTPEDLVRLGMNTAFRSAPGDEKGMQEMRAFMRRCDALGVQVMVYLSYGGRGAAGRAHP